MSVSRETVDGRAALRLERRLAYPIERVWRAVSEPAELARWFVDEPSWVPAEGEEFDAAGRHGRITAVEPPRLLAWTWGVEAHLAGGFLSEHDAHAGIEERMDRHREAFEAA